MLEQSWRVKRAWGSLILAVALSGQMLWTVQKGRDTTQTASRVRRAGAVLPSLPALRLSSRAGVISAAGMS